MKIMTVQRILDRAIVDFFVQERSNILNNVSERNLCGRLAFLLQSEVNQTELNGLYYADTEYNRKQNGQIKTILDDEEKIVRIICDIIVHSRGMRKPDNLIAIEMKKIGRPNHEKESDRMRLRSLTKKVDEGVWSNDGRTYPEHVAGYLLGVYMEIDPDQELCLVECYRNAKKISEKSINL